MANISRTSGFSQMAATWKPSDRASHAGHHMDGCSTAVFIAVVQHVSWTVNICGSGLVFYSWFIYLEMMLFPAVIPPISEHFLESPVSSSSSSPSLFSAVSYLILCVWCSSYLLIVHVITFVIRKNISSHFYPIKILLYFLFCWFLSSFSAFCLHCIPFIALIWQPSRC